MAGAGLGPRMDLGRTWNVRALFTWSCPAGRARKAMADQRFPAGKGQMLLVGGELGGGALRSRDQLTWSSWAQLTVGALALFAWEGRRDHPTREQQKPRGNWGREEHPSYLLKLQDFHTNSQQESWESVSQGQGGIWFVAFEGLQETLI